MEGKKSHEVEHFDMDDSDDATGAEGIDADQ